MPLHEQAQAFLDDLKEQRAPSWEELTPTEGRKLFSSLTDLFGHGPEVAQVDDRVISSHVPVRCYRPRCEGLLPVVVFMHGGGWVLGDLDTHDALCRRLANEAGVAVVSVGYRLAPETPFPGALDDCYSALRFINEQAAELRIDPERIVVAGDSAGGNLAAAVAWKATVQGGPPIRLQVLIYPVLNHRCNTDTYRTFSEGFGLTESAMKWFWRQYIGEGASDVNPLVSPMFAENLDGLPPAHIVTAEYDVLRDEGEQYAERLRSVGIPITHRRYAGMIHGFVHFSGLFDVGREAIGDIASIIRAACDIQTPAKN